MGDFPNAGRPMARIAGTRFKGEVLRSGNLHIKGPCGHSHIMTVSQAIDLADWLLSDPQHEAPAARMTPPFEGPVQGFERGPVSISHWGMHA